MIVTVYGASDDLIEVEGSLREEFPGGSDDGELLSFSDGTVLRVKYADGGTWRITPVHRGSAGLEVEQALEGDEDNYSDRATLAGDIRWVRCGDDSNLLGEIAYAAYFKASGARSPACEDDLPPWSRLDTVAKGAWAAAADAVKEQVER